MEVILREDVPHLGSIGDIVKVKPGYARNFLLPRGLAVTADPRNRRALEHEKRIANEKRQRVLNAAQSVAQKLAKLELTLSARAGSEGKLFGSITNLDIERALTEQGVLIERRKIRLDEPIKQIGTHKVPVHLGVGVDAEVTVHVKAEGAASTEGEEPAANAQSD